MKLTRYLIVVTLFTVAATLSNAQAQSTKKMLVGTWFMSFDDMLKKMPEKQRRMLESMPDEQKDMMRKQVNQSYFDFKADGTFETFTDSKKGSMTWKLSDDGKKLITTDTDGREIPMKIIELSKKRLLLEAKDARETLFIVLKPKK